MAFLLCLFWLFLQSLKGVLSEQCWQGASFSETIISPNLKSSNILRVPEVATLAQCAGACCDFPGCDLAWLFEGHCYIVNCERKENCEPKKRPGTDSYMTFLQHGPPQSLVLQSLVRGQPFLGRVRPQAGLKRTEGLKDLSLFDGDQGFEDSAPEEEYNESYRSPDAAGGSVGARAEQKESSGYLDWLAVAGREGFNLSESTGGQGELYSPQSPSKSAFLLHSSTPREGAQGSTPTPPAPASPVSVNGSIGDDVLSKNVSLISLELTPASQNSSADLTPQSQILPAHPTDTRVSPVATPVPTPAPATTLQPVKELMVSVGDNVEVTLPKNTVELNAFVVPEPPTDTSYSYEWSLISHPADYEGEMESKHTKSLKLSRLSSGLYVFKVSVSGDRSYGEGFVNVTVKAAARVNQSPVAIVSPLTQEVSLPTTSTFIDGSQSTDDEKIVSYHWEKVRGPLQEYKVSADTPILHLTDLVPGNYTFRLTVIDSDGAANSTTAKVLVNRPVDYPPVANAGPNQAITLPHNYITLNGNQSSDDHSIVSYEWSLSPTSKGKVVAMQGVRTPFLQLSAMQEGDYTFQLTVTDSANQQATATATVIVQAEKNSPPVAIVGPDKELTFPAENSILDGSHSTDDQGIVSFHWDCVSGPPGAKIENGDAALATVTGLKIGTYKFRLTVKDQQGLASNAVVTVTVKEESNASPVAHASGSHILFLPNNSIVLDGSASTDDQGIVSYLWVRDGQSPAAGDVIYGSEQQAMLYLTNLVEGTYLFQLRVCDSKGDCSTDTATVEVRPDPHKKDEVELELQVGVSQLSLQQRDTVLRQLAVLLSVLDTDIHIQRVQAHTDLSTVLSFYVRSQGVVLQSAELMRTLRGQLLKEKTDFLLFRVLRVDTAVCLLQCSEHGQCDPLSKSCVCDPFWMENPIRRYLSDGDSNCEWSVLYVAVTAFVGVILVMALSWACFCCCKSRRRIKGRKKTKYTILDNIDEQERMELRPKYNIKHRSTEHNSSLMISESEFESEQDTIFTREKVDKEKLKTCSNGSAQNGDVFSFRGEDR
ncbi:dyslexia-associated protein KIAA0319 isoform X1 [Amia ocellicauda]|uniref:dyslexia-associated protein KIAA0319 isoform X1 n=1 Tax=Amia ocellicauda TaxID=2972642 RepID=UPI0034641DFB